MQRLINLLTVAAATATIGFALKMAVTYPSGVDLPAGYLNPIIAFEFSKTQADLEFLSGEGNTSRAAMIKGQQLDQFFPYAYSILLTLGLITLFRRGSKVALLGIPFAIIAVPLDFSENRVLDQILELLASSESAADLIPALIVATWLKWGAIAAAIGITGLAFYQMGFKKSGVLGMVAGLTALACFVSGTLPQLAELMALLVSVFFLSLTIFAIQQLLDNKSRRLSK